MMNVIFRWYDDLPMHCYLVIIAFLAFECVILFPGKQLTDGNINSTRYSQDISFEQFKSDYKRWKRDNASYISIH